MQTDSLFVTAAVSSSSVCDFICTESISGPAGCLFPTVENEFDTPEPDKKDNQFTSLWGGGDPLWLPLLSVIM